VASGECVNITLVWGNQHYLPTVKFQCQSSNNQTNFSTTGSATCSGQYGFSGCSIAPVESGKTYNWKICVTFTGSGTASCGLSG
jgi:uncharacterized protein (DUF2147 family)